MKMAMISGLTMCLITHLFQQVPTSSLFQYLPTYKLICSSRTCMGLIIFDVVLGAVILSTSKTKAHYSKVLKIRSMILAYWSPENSDPNKVLQVSMFVAVILLHYPAKPNMYLHTYLPTICRFLRN